MVVFHSECPVFLKKGDPFFAVLYALASLVGFSSSCKTAVYFRVHAQKSILCFKTCLEAPYLHFFAFFQINSHVPAFKRFSNCVGFTKNKPLCQLNKCSCNMERMLVPLMPKDG